MAKMYILSEYEKQTGKRRKTPKQWKKICLVIAGLVLIEHAVVLSYLLWK